jgi:hypothetical protein
VDGCCLTAEDACVGHGRESCARGIRARIRLRDQPAARHRKCKRLSGALHPPWIDRAHNSLSIIALIFQKAGLGMVLRSASRYTPWTQGSTLDKARKGGQAAGDSAVVFVPSGLG